MTTQSQTTGKLPTHRIYIVTGTGDAASWKEIGAAWPNKVRIPMIARSHSDMMARSVPR